MEIMMKNAVPDIFARPPDQKTDSWYGSIRDRSHLAEKKEHILEMWRFCFSAGLHDPECEMDFPLVFCEGWCKLDVFVFFKQKCLDLTHRHETRNDAPLFLVQKGIINVEGESFVPYLAKPHSVIYQYGGPSSAGSS